MQKNKLVIFDLDNCIADDSWRIPMIKWDEIEPNKRYFAYHKKAIYDEFCNRSIVREHQRLCHRIAVLTARPSEFSSQTFRWLQRNDIDTTMTYFRPEGCELHSKELKEEQLGNLVDLCEESGYEIICAYDDREDVVRMYKANGIDAKILKIHDLCAYTAPKQVGG